MRAGERREKDERRGRKGIGEMIEKMKRRKETRRERRRERRQENHRTTAYVP